MKIIVFIVLRVCRFVLSLNYGKTGNKSVQLVLQPCCKTSWIAMLRVLPATNQTVLQRIRLMQFARRCCGKKRVLLFATKSVHVTRFTGPIHWKLDTDNLQHERFERNFLTCFAAKLLYKLKDFVSPSTLLYLWVQYTSKPTYSSASFRYGSVRHFTGDFLRHVIWPA